MIAILTDRPNVGKEIARIVGAHRFEKGYMTGNGYAVTWTFGNMLSLAMPKDYGNAKLERKDFPLVPGDFRLMVKHVRTDEGWIPDISAVMQLKTVEKVLAECDTIIAATEASREGEMTFRYLYRYLGCRQPVQRLWLSSLTDEAVRKGMTNLLPVRMFDRMFLASDSRNKADWLLGMNATRLYTIKYGQNKQVLSIGRVPDLEGIGEVEFELDRGRIKVNEYMETSVSGIYAPGDINGTKMLAHAAFRMGEVAAENALKGNHHVAKLNLTPAAIYTLPEVAAVGLTEEQAREKYDVAIGKFNFAANGRAIASDAAQGFVKVIADKKYGEVLGVHIIGPAAAELINEASTIIEMEITVEEMLKTIHGHPTFSEVMYEAFADVLGEAIHNPPKGK